MPPDTMLRRFTMAGGEISTTVWRGLVSGPQSIGRLPERIDDRESADLLAVSEIFRMELLAAKRLGRGDDRAVPVGQPMRRLDFQRRLMDAGRHLLDRKACPGADQLSR